MIRYSLRRDPGGPRYTSSDRRLARQLTASGAADTLTAEARAAMTSPAGIAVVADVLFELESNRLRRPTTVQLRIGGSVVAPATGDPATLVNGARVATPAYPAVRFPTTPTTGRRSVRLTWSGVRAVNVVEVHGDGASGQITGAQVFTLAPDGTRTLRGTESSPGGRLAVKVAPYDAPILCAGVEVEIVAADGADVAVVEVDPMLIRDVSRDVAELTVEWSRETDPGSSTDPVGTYEASTVQLQLDDTSGMWNPGTNASLDVGHRIEVALGVRYTAAATGRTVEEVLPAGVFYSEPFDTDSTATTVSISGTDRLGRNADTTVAEDVLVGQTVGTVVALLARKYLDLDADQVRVDPSVASIVLPYAYPSGNLGSYLADLAKATATTLHVDALDTLVLSRRTDASTLPVATISADTSLISFRRPPGYDVTTSIVAVTASPLAPDVVSDLWAMPAGGITVPAGGSYLLVANYDNAPAINGFVSGIVADGAYTIASAAYYAARAELTIANPSTTRALVVADLRVRGSQLVESPLSSRIEHAPSVARYGPRELTVEGRLIQTQAQLDTVARVLLDAFRSLDDAGVRRNPDVTFAGLGLIHLTAGDRVTLAHPTKGLGGDYTVLSRKLTLAGGALLMDDVRVRESPRLVDFLSLDSGELLDTGKVVGY